MSTFYSSRSPQSSTSNLSSSITGPRVITLSGSQKGPLLQQVDAELKRLRNQFETIRSDMGSENSSMRMNGASKPQTAETVTSNAGKISQSFEIRRDVSSRDMASSGVTGATYSQPPQTTATPTSSSSYTSSYASNSNSLYTPITMRTQNKPTQATITTVRPTQNKQSLSKSFGVWKNEATKAEPTKFEVRRLGDSGVAQKEEKKSQGSVNLEAYKQPVRYEPTTNTTTTRIEPVKYETKTYEAKTVEQPQQQQTVRYETQRPEIRYDATITERKYEPQVTKYDAPQVQRYEAPQVQKYEPPVQKYEPPVQKYEPPVQKYEPPVRSYQPPKMNTIPVTQQPTQPQPSSTLSDSRSRLQPIRYQPPTTSPHSQSPISQLPYQPTKIPSPARYESRTQKIKLSDFQSPSTARVDYEPTTPSRRQQDESIRRNQQKKYADQEEKVLMLTRNIDTVNRENQNLKHQITKLTNQLSVVEQLKGEKEELRRGMVEKDEIIRELRVALEESALKTKRMEEEIQEIRITEELKRNVHVSTEGGFNMALLTHLEENQRIKDRMLMKDEEIDELRSMIKTLRSENDSYRNQLEIQKVKAMSEINNVKTASDIDNQRLTGQVESLNKVVSSLDQKLKYLLKQDKKKDQFLMNYLKNKAQNPQDKDLIVGFFRQFEEVPKLTVSELMKQERQVQEQLKEEVKRMEQQLEVERMVQRDLRKRYENVRFL